MRFRFVLRHATGLAGVVAVIAAAPASATTFCVPSFHAACPNNGTNVAEANLETAMQADANDGAADTIRLAAGTFTDTGTFETGGSDALEIIGTGPDATFLTSSFAGGPGAGIFVLNLSAGGDRDVTVRDLKVVVPASFDDEEGAGVYADEAALVNVDVEVRNLESDGVVLAGGSSFSDGHIHNGAGGQVEAGLESWLIPAGAATITRATVTGAISAIVAANAETPLHVRRSRIVDSGSGVTATRGGIGNVTNTVIEIDAGRALTGIATDDDTSILSARHVTIVDSSLSGGAAIESRVQPFATSGSVNLVVDDTIVAGTETPLRCVAPEDPAIGDAELTIHYSYLFNSVEMEGDCDFFESNTIDSSAPQIGPPQFLAPGDYRLPPGSAAIDSGDPLVATLPTEDFRGAPRPVDGDGDGDARRDIGAFEYQPGEPVGPENGDDGGDGQDGGAAGGGATAGGATGGGAAGGDGATPPADFGAGIGVTLTLTRKWIRPAAPLRVRLQNANPFAVSGSVLVEARRPPKRTLPPLRSKPTPVTLGAGTTTTVALRLTRRLHARLRTTGRLGLRLRGSFTSPAGTTRSVTATTTVQLEKRERRGRSPSETPD